MTKKETEKRDAIEYLKKSINKGDTLFTITTHVSKSGMSRNIKILDIKEGNPSYWNYYISKILGYTLKDDGTTFGSLTNSGGGFFYNLSMFVLGNNYVLFVICFCYCFFPK